jgi:hypothetical protein
MSNIKDLRPDPVTVELGGKTRTIKYDLNAFAELEKRYETIDAAMEALQSGGMLGMRTVLWAGLIHEEVELDERTGEPVRYLISPYAVGSWITPGMLPALSSKLIEAMGVDMPAPENMPAEVKDKLAEAGFEMTNTGMATIKPTKEEIEAKNV